MEKEDRKTESYNQLLKSYNLKTMKVITRQTPNGAKEYPVPVDSLNVSYPPVFEDEEYGIYQLPDEDGNEHGIVPFKYVGTMAEIAENLTNIYFPSEPSNMGKDKMMKYYCSVF